MALMCFAAGAFPILISLELVSVDPSTVHAPLWVIGFAGMVFVIAGCMILLGENSRANDLLAAILCTLFGLVAIWVSFFSSNEGFSGGVPFVSYETNVKIARWIFGAGALMCFLVAWVALKRSFRKND